jgi:hypothetical protein
MPYEEEMCGVADLIAWETATQVARRVARRQTPLTD